MRRWRYRNTVLVCCTLAFFVTMFARVAISPVVPQIIAAFEVSNTAIGAALTGMWIAYGLVQFPSGVVGDRFGERVVILTALGGTAVACLLIAGAPLFVVFVAATVILGAFAGLHYSVATTLLSRIHDNVGTAVGIHNSGATIAGLVAPGIVTWLTVAFGWRVALASTALVATAAFALFYAFVEPTEPQRPSVSMREQFYFRALAELLSRPAITFMVFVAIVGEFVWQGAASFLPMFLIEHREYSSSLAAVGFSAYFVSQGFAQVGVGWVSDRFGRDLATAGCFLLGAIGIALLVVGPGLTAAALGVLLLGVGMSFEAPLLPRILSRLSEAERGTGFGLIRTVYVLTASVGSLVVGFTADVFGWGVSFGLLAVLLLLVFVSFVLTWVFSIDV